MTSVKNQWRNVSRIVACVFLSLVVVLATTSDADARKNKSKARSKKPAASAPARSSGVNDPRYADIILNPITGEVYHQDSADERRYPASLTKMMTLYMLFEALAQDKVSMGTHLDISDYASTMPQTNLSLSSGDTIPVEVAIKALVVRSANDVAVVVGEALGGDTERFAQMMTNKARALGMRNTVFRNPNGLPNNGQYTTARDMAKLGIALKRDFPQYYDYFATRQFSWNGVTYYTHNRVMLRYAGTDGIKTGFIGLSGFNVVTSVTRGGRPLVGVVMGGATGAWRDNRMIDLLDDSYRIIAERGATRGKAAPENLPLQRNPKTGASSAAGIQARGSVTEAATLPETLPEERATLPEEAGEDGAIATAPVVITPRHEPVAVAPQVITTPSPTVVTPAVVMPPEAPQSVAPVAPVPSAAAPAAAASNYVRIVSLPPKETPKPVVAIAPAPAVKPQVAAPVAPRSPIQPTPFRTSTPVVTTATTTVPAAVPVTTPAGAVWGIQVGAFSSNELATRAANDAYALAKGSLAGAQLAIAGPEANGAPVHRARIGNITEAQAKGACQTLIAHSSPCFAYKTR